MVCAAFCNGVIATPGRTAVRLECSTGRDADDCEGEAGAPKGSGLRLFTLANWRNQSSEKGERRGHGMAPLLVHSLTLREANQTANDVELPCLMSFGHAPEVPTGA